MRASLRPADAADWPRILELLDAAALPTADLAARDAPRFIVASAGTAIVGAVGLEAYGTHGLLRSLVVDPAWRGQGIGAALIAAAEARARALDLHALVLLTTTAAPLFARHGYAVIERAAAPQAVQASAEFAHLCPSSSTCMTKRLEPVLA